MCALSCLHSIPLSMASIYPFISLALKSLASRTGLSSFPGSRFPWLLMAAHHPFPTYPMFPQQVLRLKAPGISQSPLPPVSPAPSEQGSGACTIAPFSQWSPSSGTGFEFLGIPLLGLLVPCTCQDIPLTLLGTLTKVSCILTKYFCAFHSVPYTAGCTSDET